VDIADLVIILLIVSAALNGLRIGGATLFFSYSGFFLGLTGGIILGIELAPVLTNSISNIAMRTFIGLLILFFPAVILGSLGHFFGIKFQGLLTRHRLAKFDAATGAIISVIATLIATWILGNVLANSPFLILNSQLQRSSILRTLNSELPPVPLNQIRQLLSDTGFPPVFSTFEPLPVGSVKEPSTQQAENLVQQVAQSVVEITGSACNGIIEGSGFSVAPNIVVTNAHVVAGVNFPTVTDATGQHPARVIYFNPDLDLAVLLVRGLQAPPLTVLNKVLPGGTESVFMGYPEGGPLNAQPSGILGEILASGPNIYYSSEVKRDIYEIQGYVRPGNSGGPLFNLQGQVIGVIFSRSTTNNDLGYALTSTDIIPAINQALSNPQFITGTACAS
jgi:S1-C subfamily serine protease